MIAFLADRDAADAEGVRAAVTGSLRGLPGDLLRRLATSWPTEDDPADRIVTEAFAEALAERPAPEQPPGPVTRPRLIMPERTVQLHAAA
jgi:hypothetical protein